MANVEEELKRIWSTANDPGSYAGVDKLYKSAVESGLQVTRDQVKTFLSGINAYTLTVTRRRRFKRTRVIAVSKNDLHAADHMDMSHLKAENDNYAYALVVKDHFTKYLWVIPVRDHKVNTTIQAFKSIYTDPVNVPKFLQTDFAAEYLAKATQKYFASLHIRHFTVPNRDIKSSSAERAIRYIKSTIHKYLLHNLTRRYIDRLQDIIDGLNAKVSRVTGFAPAAIDDTNSDQVFKKTYPECWRVPTPKVQSNQQRGKLKIGDTVRLALERQLLDKENQIHWTNELFKVGEVLKPRDGLTRYKVTNLAGDEAITGTFYRQELQPAKDTDVYLVEKIIDRRIRRGIEEVLVKYVGFKLNKNDWIPATNLITNQ